MEKNYAYKPGDKFPYQYKYEHMGVTTDFVIFTYKDWRLEVLLIRRGEEPYKGKWALPGGFIEMDETAEEGALRELWEETGFTPASIAQLGVFSDVDRDPRERVITIAWYALVKHSEVIGGDDAEEAGWFPVDHLPDLAFDHKRIFDAAMERLRQDIYFKPVGFDLLDEEFTIPDLQRLYEAILGVKFDRRNFQRKILSSGILESAPEKEEPDYEYSPKNISLYENESLSRQEMVREVPPPEACLSIEPESRKKGRQGRHGVLFRLNKKKYAALKEDGLKKEF